MKRLIGEARRLMPDVGIQVPPNLPTGGPSWWPPARPTSAACRPTATTSRPSTRSRRRIRCASAWPRRRRADRAAVRLPRSTSTPSGSTQGVLDVVKAQVLELHPAARLRRAARRRSPIRRRPRAARRSSGRATARRCRREELTALFAETGPEAIEDDAPGRRRAARRAGGRHGHVRRQPQHQRLQRLHRRLRVLRLRAGQALARRLRARPRRSSSRRVREAVDYGATELCMQSGIHPDWTLEDYLQLAAGGQGRRAPQLHLHAYSPDGDRAHVRHLAACRRPRCSRGCARPGLGSTPGTAAEVLHDGVRERISPNKLPVARWVEIIEASHRAGLRSTVTVMFGHIEEPWELAEHMRVDPRAAGAHRRVHRVRAALVHPVPHAAGPHARRRGDLARGEPQAHRRLPPRAGQDDRQRPGQLGEDGPGGRDRGAALGRQRPRRDPDGGVDLAAWPAATTACASTRPS